MFRKHKKFLSFLLLFCLLFQVQYVQAASRYPSGITLNKKSVSVLKEKTVKLSAALSPKSVKNNKVTWTSSNEAVASVDSSGKVRVKACGTAKIVAKTENGKTASCKVTGVICTTKGGTASVATPDGVRKYTMYDQADYGSYYGSYGCVTTAVAIASSGFGKTYSPKDIHEGSPSKAYSERYALKKMKASSALYGNAAISVAAASQILKDMKIKNKAVYKFSTSSAMKDITQHLKKGKPVIIKARNITYQGIQLANAHHALVLVGIDDDGTVTFINPLGGRINYSHGKNCNLTLKTIVSKFMRSASGNTAAPYVTSLSGAGGYILVG